MTYDLSHKKTLNLPASDIQTFSARDQKDKKRDSHGTCHLQSSLAHIPLRGGCNYIKEIRWKEKASKAWMNIEHEYAKVCETNNELMN